MSDKETATYLSLSAASKLLGVHASTLRLWADEGAVPVYITPGGHRRFARADILALASRRPLPSQSISSVLASKALAQTRNELAHSSSAPAWMHAMNEQEWLAWRRVGQQLMGVVLRYVSTHDEQSPLLDEARAIGHSYARLARAAGLPLTDAIAAALFFRDSLVEAAMDLPEEARVRPSESARLLRRISRVANEVQLAVVSGYETTEE
ncbi:MAG TPA: helix-turn-helix domain-containing protein [Chloroflexus aurantiacus]|uniref:DNA binding domain protein, excisionase family n=1 Tax=Chloroflexus aurantiacus (strain ATCC 29366 / DSM 635 / J-10-fl) TaxID=324602 RepID=A9WI72_CHLAA|nr:helix-turn-helix domain-containing protein [Chloroflexus aurantiacus]ABY36364.1 DNA binding domain protein, excisionase family [Chloroflexus aurantiacus J-10-fl]HBW67915.1 helix-turn-helix domain-containing protein [Chloroflexus aurantiacus]